MKSLLRTCQLALALLFSVGLAAAQNDHDDNDPDGGDASSCAADAGRLIAANPDAAIDGPGVALEVVRTTMMVVPDGYEVAYVLTTEENGGDLVILDLYASLDEAYVTVAGDYRLHTLVAELSDPDDPNYLDASIVEFGTTTAADVLGVVADAGICASLEVPGAMFDVFECDVTGGDILTVNGTNETDICRDSVVAVFPQYAVTSDYAYILADADYEILAVVTDPADVNFAAYADATRFNIFGLSYTGELNTDLEGSVYTQRYSSRCWQITDNEIIVRIPAEDCDDLDPCVVITGGKIWADNGTNEIDVCRDSVIAVTPGYQVRANYAYILADADYEILEIVTDPADVTYAAYGDAVRFNIFGLAYTGDLDTDVRGSVYTQRYTDECWQITDNEIIVRVISEECGDGEPACAADAGMLAAVSTGDGDDHDSDDDTVVIPMADGGVSLDVEVAVEPTVPEGFEVVYVLTYEADGELIVGDIYTSLSQAFVMCPNEYRLHTLVAELTDTDSPDYLDASVVVPGETTAGAVLGLIEEAGICAALELPGARFSVTGDEAMMGLTAAPATGLAPAVDVTAVQNAAGGDVRVTVAPLTERAVERAVVTLSDANGRVVATAVVGDVEAVTSLGLSTADAGRGLHFVTVQTAEGATSRRVIVH